MKQALILIDEIKANYKAIERTKSRYLIKDRQKHIKAQKRDLKEYCIYKNINYKKLLEENNI